MTTFLGVSSSDVGEWDTKLSATDRWSQGAVGTSDRRSRGGDALVPNGSLAGVQGMASGLSSVS